jgi:hypothetical protein
LPEAIEEEVPSLTDQKWTPRERGLIAGYNWARVYEGDLIDLRPYTAGEIDIDTRNSIRAILGGSDELDQAAAFWTGFAHGVGLFLADNGISTVEWEGDHDA